MKFLTTTLTVFLCTLSRAESSSNSVLQIERSFWVRSLPHTQLRLQQFLGSIEAKLPNQLLKNVASTVTLGFRMHLTGPLQPPECTLQKRRDFAIDESQSKTLVQVESTSNSLFLNQDFFPVILGTENSSATFPCDWKNMYRWAQAEVIRGILELSINQYQSSIQSLEWLAMLNRYDPLEQDINNITLSESWIQYATHFLVDPEFPCRMPFLNRYFAKVFGSASDLARAPCLVNSNILTSTSKKIMHLDFSRLYQIHLLAAGPGLNFESRWGHTSFRLVFCNAKRVTSNEDCLKDLNDHVVVSFMGIPSNPLISPWDGLNGNYPSQLVIDDFASFLNQYTKTEDRSLTSLPLKYTKNEMIGFLERVLEEYWTYRGQYAFLTNNCAHEALRFLQSVTPSRYSLSSLSPWITTPTALIDSLEEIHLIQSLPPLKPTLSNSLYFPSVSELNNLKISDDLESKTKSHIDAKIAAPDSERLVDETQRSPKMRREQFALQIQKRPEQMRSLANQYYRVELEIYRTKEKQIDATLQRILDGHLANPSESYKKLIYSIFLNRRSLMPSFLASFDYGIPREIEVYSDSYIQNVLKEIQKDKNKLRELLKQDRPQLFEYLRLTNENMIYFYQFIKPASKALNKETL